MQEDACFTPVRSFSSDDRCFACGSRNPFGLHMTFKTDGRVVRCDFVVPGHLCGWGNLVHGGIVTTLLDETMSWTAIHLLKRLILTRRIEVDFIQTVAPMVPLRIEGRIEKRIKNTEAVVSAAIFDDAGQACAKARGRFALISAKMMRRLKIMDEAVVSDFERRYEP